MDAGWVVLATVTRQRRGTQRKYVSKVNTDPVNYDKVNLIAWMRQCVLDMYTDYSIVVIWTIGRPFERMMMESVHIYAN